MLKKLKELIIDQIWRVQVVLGLYSIFVFTPLLILSNSEKIGQVIPLPPLLQVALGTPLILFCVWLIGVFFDKKIKYQQSFDTSANKRNPQMCTLLERTEKMINQLDQMDERLKKIENGR